ncbi:hypothetical protein BS17DRAFT_871321 [Gyrodon lividus]|nr:hypothetical protein BS17DRAFT_871321 [Gyrodon lividus]
MQPSSCASPPLFAAARTGQFTVLNLNVFNHVTPGHVSMQEDHQGLEITNFHLPCTKSAPQGDVNWAKQEGLTDPQEALNTHFQVNNLMPNAHLFAYHTPHSL